MLLFMPPKQSVRDKTLEFVSTNLIRPNPNQPRRFFDEYEMNKLAQSIRMNGLIQPITVKRQNGGFLLIAGERRLRAARIAGLREVPCIIQEAPGCEAAILALVENLQRSNLGIFEEAEAIEQLIKTGELSQQEAAERLGIAQSTLANKLRLLRLDEAERERVFASQLSERHARALVRIEDKQLRTQALDRIVAKGLNVRDSEEYIETLLMPAEPEPPRPKRVMIVKDIRLFMNSMSKMVSCMRESGVDAKTNKRENDEFIEYTVIIPKKRRSPEPEILEPGRETAH